VQASFPLVGYVSMYFNMDDGEIIAQIETTAMMRPKNWRHQCADKSTFIVSRCCGGIQENPKVAGCMAYDPLQKIDHFLFLLQFDRQ
jgi:hypothetical protein